MKETVANLKRFNQSDLWPDFGTVTLLRREEAFASCKFCPWTKETHFDPRKHWNIVSRARMALQLHVLAHHRDNPEVAPMVRR